MKRKTLKIVPVTEDGVLSRKDSTESGYSSSCTDSTDSLYHTSPATPQFHRYMREHIKEVRNGNTFIGCRYYNSSDSNDSNDSNNSVRSTGTTQSEYENRIKRQNKLVKYSGCTIAIAALFGITLI
jgi:hypothetical protein